MVDFDALTERMVYLKPVATRDLPVEMQAKLDGEDQVLSVRNAQGDEIAFVANIELARELADHFEVQALALH